MMEQLTFNAVVEARFKDAAYVEGEGGGGWTTMNTLEERERERERGRGGGGGRLDDN